MRPPVAKLAFLSFPGPGVICINLQVNDQNVKAEITRDQLRNILIEGTAVALRDQDRQ